MAKFHLISQQNMQQKAKKQAESLKAQGFFFFFFF